MAQIHPTAVIAPEAVLDPTARVGPFVVIDGSVTVGPDCVLGPQVHLVGPLVLGRGNVIGTGTVIGTEPQHLAYGGQPTRTEVGDFNTFREHVTVHRGSHVEGWGVTRIGSHNYFMAHSHVGHDSRVGDHCVLANAALMGGHCEIQDRVFIGGGAAMHQFTRMGRLSLSTGLQGVTKDLPPFMTMKDRYTVVGVNVIGLRRAGFSTADISTARRAFHMLYRSGLILSQAIDRLQSELGDHPVGEEILRFIRGSRRGIMRSAREAAGDGDD